MWISTINKAIAAEGIELELVKGEGYFYFFGPGSENLYSSSVMVYRLNQLTLEQWLGYAKQYAKEIEEHATT